MNRHECIASIIPSHSSHQDHAQAYAPTNIALIKYWGKRNKILNLPTNSSLSLSINPLGCQTTIQLQHHVKMHSWQHNQQVIAPDTHRFQRLSQFLDDIKPNKDIYYSIITESNVPMAAGIASSACGFAALVRALDKLHGWQLSLSQMSILSRMASGSACRSLWPGFVQWHCGAAENGLDSHGERLAIDWPELQMGLFLIDSQSKKIGSTEAMTITQQTSPLYKNWPQQAHLDLEQLKAALEQKDFWAFGEVLEKNACLMHQCMEKSTPPIRYTTPATQMLRHAIGSLRDQGIPIFFSQDAGPNLKCFFLQESLSDIKTVFPELIHINPHQERHFPLKPLT